MTSRTYSIIKFSPWRKSSAATFWKYRGNRTQTAKALGIGASTLWRKLKGWGVAPARDVELQEPIANGQFQA
ncbi:MAG: hypothetical protein GY811_28125 [Myxococcales bacterium]|nr:hypothetical protein [Myxococcales bacterium]